MTVAGAYLYRRWRFHKLVHIVPEKISGQVQQTAQGWSYSKSEGDRTLFTVRAGKAVQYKQGGHVELHDVTITIYGHDSQRFDQIYGADFEYDPQSGTVMAKGEVQIDLETNPEGLKNPDQTPPKELKNPIHVRTSGLVFNQKTGDAYTPEMVDFQVAEARGSAAGAYYHARAGILNLNSRVNVELQGATAAVLNATSAALHREPRQIDFERPRVVRGPQRFDADHANLFLRENSTIERAVATGNVRLYQEGEKGAAASSDRAELLTGGERNSVRTVTFSGNVQMDAGARQPVHGNAGKMTLRFAGNNLLSTARAEDNVRIVQHQVAEQSALGAERTKPQDVEVNAPVIDFTFGRGGRLRNAVTSGAARLAVAPAGATPGQGTIVTAGQFNTQFDERNRLKSARGAPNAKIVNSAPGQPDRVSTSDVLDVSFRPAGGIESVVQQGNVAYQDAALRASGDQARYVPVDQTLYLTGSPRVVEGGMTTTARAMRINRATGDALAEGDVKSTYSDLKSQQGGALLASSDPIHVTARSMTTHRNPGIATYSGNARLWQGPNVIEAPSIEFDRERRAVIARGSTAQRVSTALVQTSSSGSQTPVTLTSQRLSYTDSERKAHFEGGVVVKSADTTMTGNQIDAYLQSRGTSPAVSKASGPGGPSQVERIVADGNILIVQPQRRAQGNHLVYTAAEEKFVLTGGPPSIFDAEHGKVTGDSLTFYKRDDRVLVEGEAKSPTVTQTRVAR